MKCFNYRELRFLYLIINRLLLKIDELRRIDKLTNAAVIGFSKLKFDSLFLYQKLMGMTSYVVSGVYQK